MRYRSAYRWVLGMGLLAGCQTGTRELDFISKQFLATYNVDSTRGIDSTNLASLMGSTSIYSFSEDGKGTNHIQMGMLSRDIPFTWKVARDSLFIDNQGYSVQKRDLGLILRSDSVTMMFSKQP